MGIVAPMVSSSQKATSGGGYSQDQLNVAQIVEVAWWARDMAQWDAMQAAYHPGAIVDISWFNGPATEFVSRAKQMMAAANPGQRLDLDEEKLASYRSSYRFLSYFLAHHGIKVRPDLPGYDRPKSIEALYQANTSWLNGRRAL
jgi:hypothetical protein